LTGSGQPPGERADLSFCQLRLALEGRLPIGQVVFVKYIDIGSVYFDRQILGVIKADFYLKTNEVFSVKPFFGSRAAGKCQRSPEFPSILDRSMPFPE
jgi:hypothetical protein